MVEAWNSSAGKQQVYNNGGRGGVVYVGGAGGGGGGGGGSDDINNNYNNNYNNMDGALDDIDNRLETPYVEIYFDPPKMPPIPPPPDLMPTPGGPIVVRTEEALIVIFVLILWVAAIALFFNRWGKIRMLEPYQPKFHEEHRTSCPMVEYQIAGGAAHCQHRASVSKYAVNTVNLEAAPPMPTSVFPTVAPTYRNLQNRPRQNSVFADCSSPPVDNPRKVKSAMDIQSLILNEMTPYRGSRSMIPIGDRRTSCFGNFASSNFYERRPSCCLYPPITEFRRHSGDLLCYKERSPLIHSEYLTPSPGGLVPVVSATVSRRPSCCVGVGSDFFPSRKMSCVGDNVLPPTAGVTSSLLQSPIVQSANAASKRAPPLERDRDLPSTSSSSSNSHTQAASASCSSARKASCSPADLLGPLKSLTNRRTSFNNVLAQVTSERRSSSSILRLASNASNV